ncbi:MAG: TIM44-like domain-containing protein [Bacilli bacterium]|nr:TIM44-like domain-containing protein [Bacilli bacterium]
MKKIKQTFILILLLCITMMPVVVNADSGLDAKYTDASSGESIFGALSSGFSFTGKLLKAKPGDKDFSSSHIIGAIICIITFYIFTSRYIFKIDGTKHKKTKIIFTLLGISLIPTILFSLFCFLVKTYLILYIILLIIYIIIFKIITKIITKNRFNNKLSKLKDFDKDEFNTKAFELYKDIQISWMNFDTTKLKELVTSDIYEDYKTKLDKLKTDCEKNIMDNILFKSNKITDIIFDDNKKLIECELNVTCSDYIINKEEKVVKGKKDKVNDYKYRLVIDITNSKKYVLVEKKILKQK